MLVHQVLLLLLMLPLLLWLLLLPQLLKVKRFWGSSHKVKLRALSTLPQQQYLQQFGHCTKLQLHFGYLKKIYSMLKAKKLQMN